MDPGAALVTAYPLPPDYFISLSEDEIRNMEPPLPPKDNLQSFGHPVLKEGKWASFSDSLTVEGLEINDKTFKEQITLLREAKQSMLLTYIQVLDALTSSSSEVEKVVEDLTKSQRACISILAHLRRKQTFLSVKNTVTEFVGQMD